MFSHKVNYMPGAENPLFHEINEKRKETPFVLPKTHP